VMGRPRGGGKRGLGWSRPASGWRWGTQSGSPSPGRESTGAGQGFLIGRTVRSEKAPTSSPAGRTPIRAGYGSGPDQRLRANRSPPSGVGRGRGDGRWARRLTEVVQDPVDRGPVGGEGDDPHRFAQRGHARGTLPRCEPAIGPTGNWKGSAGAPARFFRRPPPSSSPRSGDLHGRSPKARRGALQTPSLGSVLSGPACAVPE
jgi:hypothetical protein